MTAFARIAFCASVSFIARRNASVWLSCNRAECVMPICYSPFLLRSSPATQVAAAKVQSLLHVIHTGWLAFAKPVTALLAMCRLAMGCVYRAGPVSMAELV